MNEQTTETPPPGGSEADFNEWWERLVWDTAVELCSGMVSNPNITHTFPDSETFHEWADAAIGMAVVLTESYAKQVLEAKANSHGG